MIKVKRLNGSFIYVNNDLVETIETTPDTILTFSSGRKLVILESVEEVVEKIKEFKIDIGRK